MRKITTTEARTISGGRWKCRSCGKVFGAWIFAHVTHWGRNADICLGDNECWTW